MSMDLKDIGDLLGVISAGVGLATGTVALIAGVYKLGPARLFKGLLVLALIGAVGVWLISNGGFPDPTAPTGTTPAVPLPVSSVPVPLPFVTPPPPFEPDPDLTFLPDPGNLEGYAADVGQSFLFEVTGDVSGVVYGNDVYTTDSSLRTVAVHAGVLGDGQTGVVRVIIVPGEDYYPGSERNGVMTFTYSSHYSAYRVEPANP